MPLHRLHEYWQDVEALLKNMEIDPDWPSIKTTCSTAPREGPRSRSARRYVQRKEFIGARGSLSWCMEYERGMPDAFFTFMASIKDESYMVQLALVDLKPASTHRLELRVKRLGDAELVVFRGYEKEAFALIQALIDYFLARSREQPQRLLVAV